MQIDEIYCPKCGYTLQDYLSQDSEFEVDEQDEATEQEIRDFFSEHYIASPECKKTRRRMK